MHTSTGKIIYDPRRPGMKGRKDWWCIVETDREITRYYRWWVESQLHIKGMCQPSWDAHISVVRGEKPRPNLMHLWKKYHGQRVEFQYSHSPYSVPDKEGQYWMVDIECPQLLDIRKELQRPSNWKLHLTIGRTHFT